MGRRKLRAIAVPLVLVLLALVLAAVTTTVVVVNQHYTNSISTTQQTTTTTPSQTNDNTQDNNDNSESETPAAPQTNPTTVENDYLRLYVPATEVYENELLTAEFTIKQRPPVPSGYSATIGIIDSNNRFVAGADLVLSEVWGQVQYPWGFHYQLTPVYIDEVSGNKIFFGLLPGTYQIYGVVTWTDTDYRYVKVGPITITVKPAAHLEVRSIIARVDKTTKTLTLTFTYDTLQKDVYVHIQWLAQGYYGDQVVWNVIDHNVYHLSAGSSSYTLTMSTSYDISGYNTFKVVISHGSDGVYSAYAQVQ